MHSLFIFISAHSVGTTYASLFLSGRQHLCFHMIPQTIKFMNCFVCVFSPLPVSCLLKQRATHGCVMLRCLNCVSVSCI